MDPEFVDNTIKMLKRAPSEKAQKSNSESVRHAEALALCRRLNNLLETEEKGWDYMIKNME